MTDSKISAKKCKHSSLRQNYRSAKFFLQHIFFLLSVFTEATSTDIDMIVQASLQV